MMINVKSSKYIVLFAFLAIVLLNSCNDKSSVLIRIKITCTKDSKLFLEKLNFSNSLVLDSANLSIGMNTVKFRVKSIVEPTFFVLKLNGKGAITILSEPGEKIDLIINADKLNDYSVIGSKGSLMTKELVEKLIETKDKLYSLNVKYDLTQDKRLKSMIEQEYNIVIDSQRAYSTRFIWRNAMSRASVMAVYQKYDNNTYVLDRPEDLVLFKTVASTLKAIYPNSDYTKGMIKEIMNIEKTLRKNVINNIINQSVSSIPDIALPNPQGDTIRLSKYKGKVILLDFWASGNQSSVMDNRELMGIYKEFKNKGFEIYQVSLDINRDEWVNAIESASLPWICVSELNPKGSVNARTYNVTQLPANYLIDRNFSIIGKNLYGEGLKKKLREAI